MTLGLPTEPVGDLAELVQMDRVHRRIYVEPSIFEMELRSIFSRAWIYVAHESEVSCPGDFKTAHIAQQPIVVVRGEDLQVRVLFNRCTHRAATLCQEDRGNTRALRCAYHGWTFRLDGELMNPTFADGYGGTDFEAAGFNLVPVPRVDSYRGLIFASVSRRGPSLPEYLGPARRYLDYVLDCSPTGRIAVDSGVHRYRYPGNWKLQCENGVDGYHPSFVHRAYIADIPAAARTAFGGGSSGTAASLGGGHAILDTRGELNAPGSGAVRGDRHGINLLIFPNLQLIGNQIRVIHPVGVAETEVDVYPYLFEGVPEADNASRLRTHEDFYGPAGGGGPDDVEIFRRVTEGLRIEAVPWLYFMRGAGRESTVGQVRTGHVTDEQPQRGFYAEWLAMMREGS